MERQLVRREGEVWVDGCGVKYTTIKMSAIEERGERGDG